MSITIATCLKRCENITNHVPYHNILGTLALVNLTLCVIRFLVGNVLIPLSTYMLNEWDDDK